ncbi:MAG: hypothetical protein QXP36_03825 [Conexivisphaerales archaeon]
MSISYDVSVPFALIPSLRGVLKSVYLPDSYDQPFATLKDDGKYTIQAGGLFPLTSNITLRTLRDKALYAFNSIYIHELLHVVQSFSPFVLKNRLNDFPFDKAELRSVHNLLEDVFIDALSSVYAVNNFSFDFFTDSSKMSLVDIHFLIFLSNYLYPRTSQKTPIEITILNGNKDDIKQAHLIFVKTFNSNKDKEYISLEQFIYFALSVFEHHENPYAFLEKAFGFNIPQNKFIPFKDELVSQEFWDSVKRVFATKHSDSANIEAVNRVFAMMGVNFAVLVHKIMEQLKNYYVLKKDFSSDALQDIISETSQFLHTIEQSLNRQVYSQAEKNEINLLQMSYNKFKKAFEDTYFYQFFLPVLQSLKVRFAGQQAFDPKNMFFDKKHWNSNLQETDVLNIVYSFYCVYSLVWIHQYFAVLMDAYEVQAKLTSNDLSTMYRKIEEDYDEVVQVAESVADNIINSREKERLSIPEVDLQNQDIVYKTIDFSKIPSFVKNKIKLFNDIATEFSSSGYVVQKKNVSSSIGIFSASDYIDNYARVVSSKKGEEIPIFRDVQYKRANDPLNFLAVFDISPSMSFFNEQFKPFLYYYIMQLSEIVKLSVADFSTSVFLEKSFKKDEYILEDQSGGTSPFADFNISVWSSILKYVRPHLILFVSDFNFSRGMATLESKMSAYTDSVIRFFEDVEMNSYSDFAKFVHNKVTVPFSLFLHKEFSNIPFYRPESMYGIVPVFSSVFSAFDSLKYASFYLEYLGRLIYDIVKSKEPFSLQIKGVRDISESEI